MPIFSFSFWREAYLSGRRYCFACRICGYTCLLRHLPDFGCIQKHCTEQLPFFAGKLYNKCRSVCKDLAMRAAAYHERRKIQKNRSRSHGSGRHSARHTSRLHDLPVDCHFRREKRIAELEDQYAYWEQYVKENEGKIEVYEGLAWLEIIARN